MHTLDQLFELHYRCFYELPENAWKDIFEISESPFNSWKSYFKEDFKFSQLSIEEINKVYEVPSFFGASCNISDVSFLAEFKNLEQLDLSYNLLKLNAENQIVSIPDVFLIGCEIRNNQLEFIRDCRKLWLGHNLITNINYLLTNNPKLSILDLNNNILEEIIDIQKHENLIDLNLEHNFIRNMEGLINLPAINMLYLNNNSLTNAEVIINLKNLIEITIHYNNFDLEYFEKLELLLLAKGVNVVT